MRVAFSSLLRRIGVATVLAICLQAAPARAPAKPAGINPAPAMCHYMEVRLRKLHLVRPDLIPYPIAFEVYC